MSKKRIDEKLANKTKHAAPNATRGKNAGGQTNGQFERDEKHGGGRGQFSGAGDPPRMTK
jgi:hypothetical protein